MKMKAIMSLVLGGALQVGCGSDGSGAAALGPRSSDMMRAVDCGASAELALQDELRHVPAADVSVSRDGAPLSLCELLKESGKSLAIFQFAGIKCHSCLRWIEKVNGELGPYAESVLPVTVIIDDQILLTDVEMETVKSEVAPNAVWTRDLTGEAWRFFGPVDKQEVPTALAVVFDRAARGFVTSDTALTAAALVDRANEAMGVGVQPKAD